MRRTTPSRSALIQSVFCLSTTVLAMGGGFDTTSTVVNEPGGIGFDQQDPVLVETASGALLGFIDDRSGLPEYRIRVIDVDGKTTASSTELAPQEFPLRCSELQLGSNLVGDTVALWRVDGVPGRRIARLDPSTGEQVGAISTILHDEPGGGSIEEVTIEVMPDGANLVFFMDDLAFMARIYTSQFDPIGPSFLIEDNTGGNYVDTAFHEDGTFTLAWTGVNEPYFSTVRSRRFNADGTPSGVTHNLTTDAGEVFIDTPAIAGRPDGRAVVSWLNNDFMPVIFGQALDADGDPFGQPQPLVLGDSIFGDPRHLFAKSDGSWALVQQREFGEWASTVQVFDAELAATDTVLTVEGTLKNQSIWLSSTEDVLMVWESTGDDSNKDIRGTKVSTSSDSLGREQTLSDDSDGADQFQPAVDADRDGNVSVAWLDRRSGDLQIYFQRYDDQDQPVGMNTLIEGASPAVGGHLGVSVNATGSFVISWVELFNGRCDLKAQRFEPDSTPLGEVMSIASSEGWRLIEDCLVKIFDDGRVLASWNQLDFAQFGWRELDLYQRLYSASGVPLTLDGLRVDVENSEIRAHQPLDATETEGGGFLLHYARSSPDPDDADAAIGSFLVRSIGFDGMPMGTERVIFSVPYRFDQVSSSALGMRYAVAWTPPSRDSVFLQSGSLIEGDIRLDVFEGEGVLGDPDVIRTETGACLLAYSESVLIDEVRLTDMKAVQCDLFDRPVGEPFVVFQAEGLTEPDSDLAIASDRIVGVYPEWTRTDQGLDVFMAVARFDPCLAPDFNCDGRIEGQDLNRLLGFWGMAETDLNGDATTDGEDLLILIAAWTG